MLKPAVDTGRNLHILSADLILRRRTLAPIKTLVSGLRRYDVDRVAALLDGSTGGDQGAKVVGFMSPKAIVYLVFPYLCRALCNLLTGGFQADVYDHLEYVLSQLDVIAGIGQNLVDYTFNV